MKIRYVVTIEVDEDAWSEEYGMQGCSRSDIRDDVKSYLNNAIDCGGGGAELMERLTQR